MLITMCWIKEMLNKIFTMSQAVQQEVQDITDRFSVYLGLRCLPTFVTWYHKVSLHSLALQSSMSFMFTHVFSLVNFRYGPVKSTQF